MIVPFLFVCLFSPSQDRAPRDPPRYLNGRFFLEGLDVEKEISSPGRCLCECNY